MPFPTFEPLSLASEAEGHDPIWGRVVEGGGHENSGSIKRFLDVQWSKFYSKIKCITSWCVCVWDTALLCCSVWLHWGLGSEHISACTLCTAHATMGPSVEEGCLKHVGSDLTLRCHVVFSPLPANSSLTETWPFGLQKTWTFRMFLLLLPSLCEAGIPWHWVVLECLIVSSSLSCFLQIQRSLNECWLGTTALFLMTFKMALNIL